MQVSSQSWCLWLTHRVNCWQDSQERRWVCLRRKLNCEYRRCHLRSHVESISLDHRTFKHPRISDATSEIRLSELEEFWDSEMAKPARKVLKVGKNGTLQANEEFRRHVESNLLNGASYNWIFIVNGHSMKLNEITCRFSQLNHPIKRQISTHSLLSYFRMFDYLK